MSDPATRTATCPRCGLPQPERLLVGGLCPACLGRGLKQGLLGGLDAELEDKEPQSVNVQGYEIHELIGGGGMGEVYRAVLTARGREVAIKVVAGRLTRDPEITARFESEVEALSKLDHPNVVRVLDHGETANGRHFLVTEFVDGCDLRRLLRAQRLETERAFDIFLKVCAGVAHAHERGLVHRDIKPANILTGRDGTVKVADFGLAKTLVDTSVWYGFTQTRDTFGTPYYVAPEVTRHAEQADARADVYALGVLLYELLAGAVPMGKFTPLSERTGLDRRLDKIVADALADDPAKRTSSVDELRAAVQEVARRHQRGISRQRRSRRMLMAAAVFALLGVGLAAGAWLTRQKQAATSRPPLRAPESATKEKPWTNSLGMKFVPVPGTGLLASIWETRVQDYRQFAAADNAVLPEWRSGPNDPRSVIAQRRLQPPGYRGEKPWKAPTWNDPGFEQGPDHPVCGMNLIDARLFCAWLTWKERIERRIRDDQRYRLPSDLEWSKAACLSPEEDMLPPTALDLALEVRENVAKANFAGQEVKGDDWLEGARFMEHTDLFVRTAPVGSYPANALGIHDLLGNVYEWTDSKGMSRPGVRSAQFILRGGSWTTGVPRACLLADRHTDGPGRSPPNYGFRVVLELKSAPNPPAPLDPVQQEQ